MSFSIRNCHQHFNFSPHLLKGRHYVNLFHTFKYILILEKSYKAFLFYYKKPKQKVGVTEHMAHWKSETSFIRLKRNNIMVLVMIYANI